VTEFSAPTGVRTDQQLQLAEFVHRQVMKQSGKQEPIGRRERRLGQLPLQDRQLVPQHQDLDLLLTITHRQQPYHADIIRESLDGSKTMG
jgi:hypothetical protein